jgi:type VI protein secretion system component VasF
MHAAAIDKGEHDPARGANMKLFSHHDTQARRPRVRRHPVILFAVAVAVLALAWLIFKVVLRVVTLD